MGAISRGILGAVAAVGLAGATLAVAAPAGAAERDCEIAAVTVSNVTSSSADIRWVPTTSDDRSRVYSVTGIPGKDITTSSQQVHLTGLPSSRNLTVSVSATCFGGLFPSLIEGSPRTETFSTLGDNGGVRETPTTVQGPGDGFYRMVKSPGEVLAKSSSCAEGNGGPLVSAVSDYSKFSQQWKFIKQPNGTYVIASLCQPTVLLTAHPQGGYSLEYGTAGRQGELGSWDPGYEYNVAHTPAQEWEVQAREDGYYATLTNGGTGQRIDLLRLTAV